MDYIVKDYLLYFYYAADVKNQVLAFKIRPTDGQ